MSKKYFVQPTGAWGIIMWSIALSLFCLGIIMQLEIMSFSFIPFLIWIIDGIYVFYIISNSWVKITTDQIIIREPYYKMRTFKHSDVTIKATDKWNIELDFNNKDFFPFKFTSTKGILNIIRKEAGESNVISK